MKPRIFIDIHYMEIGGAEISLIGLLQAIDYSRVDVDLFVDSHRGELMELIPPQVNLLPEVRKYSFVERPIAECLRRGYFDVAAARLIARLKYTNYRRCHPAAGIEDLAIFQYVDDAVTPVLPSINPHVEYDLAVCFCGMRGIALKKVRARRRVAWIHTDFAANDSNRARDLQSWQQFDYIASISPQISESFVKLYPSLAPKIVEIENILSPAFVRSRAEGVNVSTEMTGSPIILSVGRYCTAKNYDNVPDIACRIVEAGFPDLRWYIIGYGDDSLIRQRIAEAGMERHVVLLGKKTNPYPYIAACDVYAQPSRYEGKSVTVREAQMLGRPVVVTAYPTAPSQIRHGVDGLIVPMDNAGCASAIAALLAAPSLRHTLQQNLASLDFGNMAEVEKFYSLLD